MKLLAIILHYANQYSKEKTFYKIKDRLLKKYGIHDGYDVQHIPGKKCFSCAGTGQHVKYSWYAPYKAYDWQECWNCTGGWFKMPQWICLERRIWYGFIFHKPLKRELMVKNPFTTKKMGWEVSNRPVIESYIEHQYHWFGRWAVFILYCLYDRKSAKAFWKSNIGLWYFVPRFIKRIKWRTEMWWRKMRRNKKNYFVNSSVERTVYHHEYENLPF